MMIVRALFLVLSPLLAGVAAADEVAAAMRAIVEKNADAVVTVKVVLKESYSMEEYGSDVSEYTQEIHATVISAAGLMVTSFMQVDPSPYMEAFGEDEGFESKTEVTSLKVMRGGAEVLAEIVLRDRDLDLAFLRPVKPADGPWAFVDLAPAVSAAAFDPVVTMHRLGKVARHASTADFVRIAAVSERPRTLYILGEYPGAGTPVFLPSGPCLGINVTRLLQANAQNGLGADDDYELDIACVVVPGPEIMEIAAQVPAYVQE